MDQANVAAGVGIEPRQPKRCPLCGATVPPDPLGLYECVCGWGGPGDPLEHDRGLAKVVAKIDRSLADGQAHRDLRRMATRDDAASSLNPFYVAVLLIVALLMIAVVVVLAELCIWLIVLSIRDRAWLGAIIGGILLAIVGVALASMWPRRSRSPGVLATRERFPKLMAAIDEVCQR